MIFRGLRKWNKLLYLQRKNEKQNISPINKNMMSIRKQIRIRKQGSPWF
mgnify:CR=1 FL=1